ncbi:MAG: carboxypeptidase regulatory-like domain-containing protein [Planctomycetes bacterium]|nr:carboxypeptidase regulatory-like domain-containing protein [Planctomycetota bacterium]
MDYSKAGLVQVGGTVRLGGKPLSGAVVVFENPENGTFSCGRTTEAGRYTLMFDSVQPGVTKGRKTVRIKTTGAVGEDDPDARAGAKEAVPACYNSQSTLTVEITADSQATDFDLDPQGAK